MSMLRLWLLQGSPRWVLRLWALQRILLLANAAGHVTKAESGTDVPGVAAEAAPGLSHGFGGEAMV